MPQKSEGKGKEKHTLKEATKAQPQNAKVQRKSQEQSGEEETQSNDWEIRKSEGESEKKGSLKTTAQKLNFSGKPKSHIIKALNSTCQNLPHGHEHVWRRHHALNVEQNPKSHAQSENCSSSNGHHDTS